MFLLTRHQAIHTQLSDSSNNLSFSSRVYHRLSFLSRLFPPQYIYIYPPPTRSSISCFSTSVHPTRTDPRHSMAAFHSSHVLSHARRAMQRAYSPSSPRICPDGSQRRGEQKGIQERTSSSSPHAITIFLSSRAHFRCTSYSRTRHATCIHSVPITFFGDASSGEEIKRRLLEYIPGSCHYIYPQLFTRTTTRSARRTRTSRKTS